MREKISGVFCERLKLLRSQRKMSQAQLAKKLNISQGSVAGWEILKSEPGHNRLCQIADVFGVSVDYLVGHTDIPLTTISSNTPYEEVTPFEREILTKYRHMNETEQAMACRVLGLTHPAEERLRAKKTS